MKGRSRILIEVEDIPELIKLIQHYDDPDGPGIAGPMLKRYLDALSVLFQLKLGILCERESLADSLIDFTGLFDVIEKTIDESIAVFVKPYNIEKIEFVGISGEAIITLRKGTGHELSNYGR